MKTLLRLRGLGIAATVTVIGGLAGVIAALVLHDHPHSTPHDMVRIPESAGAGHAFWIDAYEVTNARFARFVAATGYVTEMERRHEGVVFAAADLLALGTWWRPDATADWRSPDGADATGRRYAQHPVVQVTRADAEAYARWLGRRLPTEAEWQAAAAAARRGGPPADHHADLGANTWQGLFPLSNEGDDGFVGRAPVGRYPANAYGVYDMVGNVWEWTADGGTDDAVLRGGSYLCSSNWCQAYRVSGRQIIAAELAAPHIGFRTVADF